MAENKIAPPCKLLIIGGSAGSLEALLKIVPWLNNEIELSIIIVIHRKSSYDSQLSTILQERTNWPIKEVSEKDKIKPHHIYIAPGDYHLLIENDFTFSLDDSEKVNFCRPSIDVSFESAAEVYKSDLIALLLSGANADGAKGLQQVKLLGGIAIVQDPSSAEISYMPEQAILTGKVDYILSDGSIGELIHKLSV
jgi:two-component system chemotaxis response regulator CheB